MTGINLDELERAAGLDPDSPSYKLATALAEADDELLEALVQMRKDKGLTQTEVAKRMKRDKAAVSNFERLSADPHLSTVRRYAAAIGASVTHDVRDAEDSRLEHRPELARRKQAEADAKRQAEYRARRRPITDVTVDMDTWRSNARALISAARSLEYADGTSDVHALMTELHNALATVEASIEKKAGK